MATGVDEEMVERDDCAVFVHDIVLPERAIEILEDQLTMYFQSNSRSGGGDVEQVEIISFYPLKARITFDKASVAQSVLSRDHEISGHSVRVMKEDRDSEPGMKTQNSLLDRTIFHQVVAMLLYQNIPLPKVEAKLLVERVLQGSGVTINDDHAVITGPLRRLNELNMLLISEVKQLVSADAEAASCDYDDLLDVITTLKLDEFSVSVVTVKKLLKQAVENVNLKIVEKKDNTLRMKGKLHDIMKVNENLISLLEMPGNRDGAIATKQNDQNTVSAKLESDKAKTSKCRTCGMESLNEVVWEGQPSNARDVSTSKSNDNDQATDCSDQGQLSDKELLKTFEVVKGVPKDGLGEQASDDQVAGTETEEENFASNERDDDNNEERQEVNIMDRKNVITLKHKNDTKMNTTAQKTPDYFAQKSGGAENTLPNEENDTPEASENNLHTEKNDTPKSSPTEGSKNGMSRKDEVSDNNDDDDESSRVHAESAPKLAESLNDLDESPTEGYAEGRENDAKESFSPHISFPSETHSLDGNLEHTSQLVIKIESDVLFYLSIIYSNMITKIQKQSKVSIDVKGNSCLCIEPDKEYPSKDAKLGVALETLNTLIKSIKANLKYCIIHVTEAESNSDKMQEAKEVLDQYERENKLVNIKMKSEEYIKLLSEDEESLHVAAINYCKKVGITCAKHILYQWSEKAQNEDAESNIAHTVNSPVPSEAQPVVKCQSECTDEQNNTTYDADAETHKSGETENPSFEISPKPQIDASREASLKSSAEENPSVPNLETQQSSSISANIKNGRKTESTSKGNKGTNDGGKKGKDMREETKHISKTGSKVKSQSGEMSRLSSGEVAEIKKIASAAEIRDALRTSAQTKGIATKSKQIVEDKEKDNLIKPSPIMTEAITDSESTSEVIDAKKKYQTAEEVNSADFKEVINESVDNLCFLFQMYSDEIENIEKANKVYIKWFAKDERFKEMVYIIPCEDCSRETFAKAKKKFNTLLKAGTASLKKRTIDLSRIPNFKPENEEEAESALEIYEKDVAYYSQQNCKYILLSNNEEQLNKAAQLFKQAIEMEGQNPELQPKSKSKVNPTQKASNKTKSSDAAGIFSKQATVEENILAYMFHVYRDVLRDMERDGSVKFIWNRGDDVTVEAVEGPAKGSQKNVEKGYEAFVSFVQKHHSKITGKDIDLREKNVQAAKIIDAINYTHAKHGKILLRNKETKCLRILGENDETKVAMETFYNYLGVGSHPARHGGKKRHGAPAELPRSNSYQDDESDQGSKVMYSVELGTVIKFKVLICKGDITKENVDAIANAANERLSHGAGVAGAIVKAGGASIQRESNEIMQRRRQKPLELAEVVYTRAGNLPCKWVLHTVGPKWDEWPEDFAEETLFKCCLNLLVMAEGLKVKSIAIPAIGTGLYGTPKDICAEMMHAAVIQYCTKSGTSIEEIRFIDIDDTTVQAFRSVFSKVTSSKSLNLSNVGSTLWSMRKESSVDGDNFQAASISSGSGYTGTGTTEYTGYQGQVGSKKALWSQIAADNSNTESSRGNQGAVRKSTTGSTFNSNPQIGNGTLTDSDCAICLSKLNKPTELPCRHKFCKDCLDRAKKAQGPTCPVCKHVFGIITGNMPKGTMTHRFDRYTDIPGYPRLGCIVITYFFLDGKQGKNHPNPGKRYTGTSRTAYLPNTIEGQEVLSLLKTAFDRQLTFTIGTSRTTGLTDTVTWNDIHHKTSTHGGPQNFGYPDPDYLKRVKEELAARGVK